MKIFILMFFIFISLNAWSFILMGQNQRLPDGASVKFVMSTDSCANIGISRQELKAYVEDAIDLYWNTVETSSLHIEDGGDVAGETPASNQFIIVCSTSMATTSTCYPEAFASMGSDRGYVYINNHSSAANCWATRSRSRLAYVMAHEIGHALGLDHSKDKASIMTYESHEWTNPATSLSQDDRDGITYLYPSDKELGGLMGSCGTVALLGDDDEGPKNGPPLNSLLSLALGFLLIMIIRRGVTRTFSLP